MPISPKACSGYGRKYPEWLATDLILSQSKGADKNKVYRVKVQDYAKEEKKLWEDLRHGMIIGSQKFVDKIRKTYLPSILHKEIPQQRRLSKSIDPIQILNKAAQILDCNLNEYKRMPRILKADRANRDLLVLLLWKTGVLTNSEIGNLFGMTYSSVSHIVKTVRSRMLKNRSLKRKFDQIYSQYKM